MKMELTVSSKTSAIRTQTLGNYPKRNNLQIQCTSNRLPVVITAGQLVTPSYNSYDNNKNHMFDTKLSPSRCDAMWSGWWLPTSWKKKGQIHILEQLWVAWSFKTLVTTNQTAIRQNANSCKISQRSKFSTPGTGTVHNSVSWEFGISHERKRPSVKHLWKTPMYPHQTSKHTNGELNIRQETQLW